MYFKSKGNIGEDVAKNIKGTHPIYLVLKGTGNSFGNFNWLSFDKVEEVDKKLKELNAKVINAADKATELGNAKVMNIILLGTVIKGMHLEDIDWEQIIRDNVKEKFIDINIRALHEGMALVS